MAGIICQAITRGHTAAASLLAGLALFVLLDPVWEVVTRPDGGGGGGGRKEGGDGNDSDSDAAAAAVATSVAARGVERIARTGAPVGRDARLALWAAATAVTAAGRVVGNRHWWGGAS